MRMLEFNETGTTCRMGSSASNAVGFWMRKRSGYQHPHLNGLAARARARDRWRSRCPLQLRLVSLNATSPHWQQIRPLLKDPAQITYEIIRPVILWGETPKERAAETGGPLRVRFIPLLRKVRDHPRICSTLTTTA